MKIYKNIVFDVGGVLLDYRWQQMLQDYGLSMEEADRVGRKTFDDPDGLWREYDRGVLTQEEVIAAYAERYPADEEVIRWFISHGEYMHVARPKVWKKVHELKEKGYRIYLLSNYSEDLFKKHTEYADFMKELDGLIVSYMIKKVKPDPAIYHALCEKYGLIPEECLFFDDREENVKAAIAYGMDAIQVISAEGLLQDLDKL